MEKQLDKKKIRQSMEANGLNQAALAKKLQVSRTIVSSWLGGRKFPRPDKLLRLGQVLELPFDELVNKSVDSTEPIVAFRKKGTRITKDTHIVSAKEIGHLLEMLTPYLPNEGLFQPPCLIDPKLEYNYIQKVAHRLRSEINKHDDNQIEFEQLIDKLNHFKVILIPVFHGQKEHHENALHIYLPTSKITWVFLNLDSNVHDFKFWMAHELGHAISPSLRGESAEDFADMFAQALLFPQDRSEVLYGSLKKLRSKRQRINIVLEVAESLTISPVTVYKAVGDYSAAAGITEINLEPEIYAATTSFNRKFKNISDILFNDIQPDATNYIKKTKDVFESPFFEILKVYLSDNEKSAGFIQSILDCSILDAKEIYAELVR